MMYAFRWKATPCGVTVWVECPSGRRETSRFRNGYADAMAKARLWVSHKVSSFQAAEEDCGREIQFNVPKELEWKRDS